jgi:Pvc16 N-terminal domain
VINQLDEMLAFLLLARLNLDSSSPVVDVFVRPPDDSWRAFVSLNPRPAVNLYLAEVREDREQRSTRANRVTDPEPFRVDCHYLLSAWVPSKDPTIGTPTIVEDWLLGECIRILADETPINATRIYAPAAPPVDPILVENDLRTEIAPPEGYANLGDFWTGLGQGNIWHAAAHLIVTLPLARSSRPTGPPVTTLHTTVLPGPEQFVHIGGSLRDTAGAAVPDAWVQLEDPATGHALRASRTDETGRFRLYDLIEGEYRIRASTGLGNDLVVPVTVPSPTGRYEFVTT